MAYDIAYFDREIFKRTETILALKAEIAGYITTIRKCVDEKKGISFYSCKNNTGKTLNDWRALRDRVKKTLVNAEEELAFLKKERAAAQKAIDIDLDLRRESADVETIESIASGEAAKKYGLWAAIIGAVGIFGYIFVKKIRS